MQEEKQRRSIENLNTPCHTTKVDAAKNTAMRRALLSILPLEKPGFSQTEMGRAVLPFLPDDLFQNGEKATWRVKCVKLDLEAEGIVQ